MLLLQMHYEQLLKHYFSCRFLDLQNKALKIQAYLGCFNEDQHGCENSLYLMKLIQEYTVAY